MPGEGATVVHLRILVPEDLSQAALDTVLRGAGRLQRRPAARRGRSRRPATCCWPTSPARARAGWWRTSAPSAWWSGARSAWTTRTGHLSAASARASERAPGRARRRGGVGGGRGRHLRGRRAQLELPPLHGDGGPHRRRRHLPRLADPHRGRHGRGAGVRSAGRRLRRAGRGPARAWRGARSPRWPSASRSRSPRRGSAPRSTGRPASRPRTSARPTTACRT